MAYFLAMNWIWILFIGRMLFVHLRHRGGGREAAPAPGTWATPTIPASGSLAPLRFPSGDFDVVLPTRRPHGCTSVQRTGGGVSRARSGARFELLM